MEQSQVYIKIDSANRVIACEGGYSKSNISNIEDWIFIDEGVGDRYSLCQAHYFPRGLTTEDGIPLYRWDGTQVVARTEEEIAADRAALPGAEPSEVEKLQAENKLLTAQVTALTDQNDFQEELVVELADIVYA